MDSSVFSDEIEAVLGRKIGKSKRGRPRIKMNETKLSTLQNTVIPAKAGIQKCVSNPQIEKDNSHGRDL